MWQCYIQTFTSTKYSPGSPQSPWPSSWDRSWHILWAWRYQRRREIQSRRASCRPAGCTACPAFPTPRTLSCSPRTPHWLVAISEKDLKRDRGNLFSSVWHSTGGKTLAKRYKRNRTVEHLESLINLPSRMSHRLKINETSNLIIITSIIRSTKAFSAQSS